MADAALRIAAVWADPDLIEVEVVVRFQEWGGAARAYVTRGELLAFAAQLDSVARGATAAEFLGGQRDLGYAEVALREYDRPRHLAMDVLIGRTADERPGPGRCEVQVSVPVERGALPAFADGLRHLAEHERGEVALPLPPEWP
jgi:hypothetical protein